MLPSSNAIDPAATVARLFFLILDADNAPVTGAVAANFTSIGRASFTDQVASTTTNITPLSDGANPQASLSAGTVIEHGQGVYSVDAPGGPFAVDVLYAVPVPATGTHQVFPYSHPVVEVPTAAANATATRSELAAELAFLDEAVSAPKTLTVAYNAAKTASQFDAASDAVIVGTNNDKTGYGLTSGERSTLAGVIDLAIINQVDGADLVGALADAIAADWIASDASPLAIVAALKADSTYTTLISDAEAGKTAAELVRDRLTSARAAKLDRDLAAVSDIPTAVQIRAEMDSNSTQLSSISTVATKLDGMLQDDGASGWQYTVLAVANAPGGASTVTVNLSASTEITNAVSADGGTITLKRGDDYTGTDLSWSSAVDNQWDLAGKTLVFGFVNGAETLEVNAVIDQSSGGQLVSVPLTAAQTAVLAPTQVGRFDLRTVDNTSGDKKTIISGKALVLESYVDPVE